MGGNAARRRVWARDEHGAIRQKQKRNTNQHPRGRQASVGIQIVRIACLHDHRTSKIQGIVIVVRGGWRGRVPIMVIVITVVIAVLVVEQPTEVEVRPVVMIWSLSRAGVFVGMPRLHPSGGE